MPILKIPYWASNFIYLFLTPHTNGVVFSGRLVDVGAGKKLLN